MKQKEKISPQATLEKTRHSRFSLTTVNKNDVTVIEDFKGICKKQKKRYTQVALNLFREYIDDYKAIIAQPLEKVKLASSTVLDHLLPA